MNKKVILFISSIAYLQALEFGVMGNVSAGMGGAGVALKNSPFALYYNPALLSAESSVKIGYSVGVGIREKNLDKAAGINLKNFTNGIDINNANTQIKEMIKDLDILKGVLQENALNIVSQNGIALQISPSFLRGSVGTFGVGFFSSFYGANSIKADPNRMELIFKSGNDYIKVDSAGNQISTSTQDEYEKTSLEYALRQGDAHYFMAHSLLINEIPLGYAHTFYSRYINWNIGLSARLMSVSNALNNISLSVNTDFAKEAQKIASKNNFETKTGYAIDVGSMIEIDLPDFQYLTFGFVAKNVNSPKFAFKNSEIEIKPQFRAGIAYNHSNFVIAFDGDILKNEMFSDSNVRPYSQMIGGGIKFDIKAFDIRVGAMKDLRQDDGVILTSGVNFLGFLDLAVQAGTKLGESPNYKLPRYLVVRLGGNFSF